MQRTLALDGELCSLAVAQLFELSHHGMVWVDSTARVVLSNSPARTLLAKGDGVRLRFGCSEVARALESFLGRLDRLGSQYTDWLLCRIERPSGAAPYLLIAMPWASSVRGGGALVPLEDLVARPALDEALCRLAYGLTPAEIRVTMRLLEGRSAPEIAIDLTLSTLTVRTHIKRIFKKIAVRSQTQLIAALSQLAFLPSQDPSTEHRVRKATHALEQTASRSTPS